MPARVLIAGAGVAALEAALALRSLAADRVDVELLGAEHHFWYRPLSVTEPFGLGEAKRYALPALGRSVVQHLRVLAGLIAGATAVAAFALPLKLNIVVAIGVAVLLCFWIEKGFVPNPATEDDA